MSVNLWTTSLRRLLADLGIGGAFWNISRPTAPSPLAAVSVADAGLTAAYVVQSLPSALALALGGAQAPRGTWWLLAGADTDLQIGDVAQSDADDALVFTLQTADEVAGVTLCRLSVGGVVAA